MVHPVVVSQDVMVNLDLPVLPALLVLAVHATVVVPVPLVPLAQWVPAPVLPSTTPRVLVPPVCQVPQAQLAAALVRLITTLVVQALLVRKVLLEYLAPVPAIVVPTLPQNPQVWAFWIEKWCQ